METRREKTDVVVRSVLELAREAHFLTPAKEKELQAMHLRPVELYDALREAGVSEEKTALLLACSLHLSFVHLDAVQPDRDSMTVIPEELCRRYSIMPLRRREDLLYVAVAPERAAALATFLTKMLGLSIVPVATVPDEIQSFFETKRRARKAAKARAANEDFDTPITAYEAFPEMYSPSLAS